jgi:uncharacterized YigZ family protein
MSNAKRYSVLARETRVTETIKGSRFISTAARVGDAASAGDFVRRIKEEFPDATHNCWAWVAGPPGSTASNGSSDDGEPGGTAGMPILNVLLNSGVGDVAVVVTRYYGGVKLGRGGLVRAYGGGAKRVLVEAPRTERVFYVRLEVTADYAAVDTVRRLVDRHQGVVDAEDFGERAVFTVDIPEESAAAFEDDLTEAGRGKYRATRLKSP